MKCVYLCEVKIIKTVVLLGGKNGIPQTGVPLAYTINSFGPSAGRVFICDSEEAFISNTGKHLLNMLVGVVVSNISGIRRQ